MKSIRPELTKNLYSKGVAEGAGVRFEDILALNVRTEIAFGMYQSDGCTSFSWKKGKESFLSQNWDVCGFQYMCYHHEETSVN